MNRVAEFIVERRIWIFIAVMIFTGVSFFWIPKVGINTDMTEYLADDSSMKIGMDLMKEEFPEAEEDYTVRVMFRGLTAEQKLSMKERLEGITNVTGVDYKTDDEAYNRDDYVKYVLHTAYDYESDEEHAIEETLEADFSENEMKYANDGGDHPNIPTFVLVGLVVILTAILIVMCNSWVEPFLFLFTIGIAIAINFGTNIVMGTISETTFSVTAMLQLVLSMDYSIILSNRYRQELAAETDRKAAMKAAVTGAFSSISGSSLTTVTGLLALVFMRFKIGLDLGIVLAKGVLLSVICVFLILPGLLLTFSGLLEKTRKPVPKTPTGGLAGICNKYRLVFAIAFVLLFIGAYILKDRTVISYAMISNDAVAEVFPENETVVLLYDNRDDGKMTELASELKTRNDVESAANYTNTLGAQHTAADMVDAIDELSDSMGGNRQYIVPTANTYKLLYHVYYGGKPGNLTVMEFLQFVMKDVMLDPTFAPYIEDIDPQEFMAAMSRLDQAMMVKPLSAAEMAEAFATVEGFNEATVSLMYLYHDAILPENDDRTMSIEQLMNFLSDTLVVDPAFRGFMDDEMIADINRSAADLNDGVKQLKGQDYSRLILSVTIPEEGPETDAFYEYVNERCSDNVGEFHLIGASAMNYEMSRTFDRELLQITLLTAIAIFLVVLITFRSLVVPVVLVLLVQCGVYITITVIGFQGYSINYLALLIVQCILMGSMIDYGILFSNYYRDARKRLSVAEALKKAYAGSIHTILTSGLIIVIVTAIFGQCFGEPTVEQICQTISIGATSAILLILFLLPGVLACFDRFTAGRHSLKKQVEESMDQGSTGLPVVSGESGAV